MRACARGVSGRCGWAGAGTRGVPPPPAHTPPTTHQHAHSHPNTHTRAHLVGLAIAKALRLPALPPKQASQVGALLVAAAALCGVALRALGLEDLGACGRARVRGGGGGVGGGAHSECACGRPRRPPAWPPPQLGQHPAHHHAPGAPHPGGRVVVPGCDALTARPSHSRRPSARPAPPLRAAASRRCTQVAQPGAICGQTHPPPHPLAPRPRPAPRSPAAASPAGAEAKSACGDGVQAAGFCHQAHPAASSSAQPARPPRTMAAAAGGVQGGRRV